MRQSVELYRPGSATEGDAFSARWCDQCRKMRWCRLPGLTMVLDVDDPGYPSAWRYLESGAPGCVRFERKGTATRTRRRHDERQLVLVLEAER